MSDDFYLSHTANDTGDWWRVHGVRNSQIADDEEAVLSQVESLLRANRIVLKVSADGEVERVQGEPDRCPAFIYHGPGHQSKSTCEVLGEHEVHEAMRGELRWKGDEGMTGFFNESPLEG